MHKHYTDKFSYLSKDSHSHHKHKRVQQLKEVKTFQPCSIVLSNSQNVLLNKDNHYCIPFNLGITECSFISINEYGSKFSFNLTGSYRFEFQGRVQPFSMVKVKLVFHISGNKNTQLEPFTHHEIECDQYVNLSTILPIKAGQKISVRIVPEKDESVAVIEHTRVLIYRVA